MSEIEGRSPRPQPRRGVIVLSDRATVLLRRVAFIVGATTVVALSGLALMGRMPRNPEGDWFRPIEGPAQMALLGLAVVGLLLARRWAAPGAVLIVLAGLGMSVLAAISYRPVIAVSVAVAFLCPSVLLWVAWQHRETLGRIVLLAVVTATLMTASWVSASIVYDHFFGPAHPSSATPALDDPLIDWAWAGATGASGFTVVVQPAGDAETVEMAVREVMAPAGAPPVATVQADVVDGVARMAADGLEPSTDHTYDFVVDGRRASSWSGTVRTFPDRSIDEITIAVSSCSRTGSNGQVFDAIRAVDPDLYVVSGDIHYANIGRNSTEAFAKAYDEVLTAPSQSALYRSVPIAYVWDDHDYSGNDGDSSAASRPAARAAYERAVPHYALGDPTINQAFSVGSVRVVLLDTRSAREPDVTMLGAEQLRWLRTELLTSAATHDLVVIVSPTPWIGEASASSDSWAGFAEERASLSQFFADNQLDNLLIVGGDAHMVAIDDGTNSDYSSTAGAPVPVLQAAALDRPGSVKGGPYSEGTYPGAGQFGLITVRHGDRSTATSTEVEISGHRYDGEIVVTHRFSVPLASD